MATAEYRKLPFQEAIDFFRQKININTDSWLDIWEEQHDVAFVVAGAKAAVLADFREAVDKAIADGMSRADFLKEFDRIVERYGWSYRGGRDWRANTIYGTNLRTAYAAGRYQQMNHPAVRRLRPYWKWIHGDSRVPRPLHLSLDEQVFPADSEFWQSLYPPAGWGCKCRVVSLSERDLQRMGKEQPDTPPEVGELVEVADPVTGNKTAVRAQAEPGWSHTPGSSTPSKRQQILAGLPPELQAQVKREAGE